MKNLTIDEFEIMLEATGYLPPSNEDELAFFDQMYEDISLVLRIGTLMLKK